MLILEILHYLLLFYLGISVLFLINYALLGKIPYRVKQPLTDKKNTFAVFIPGYKEDAVIFNVAKAVLTQDYDQDLYDVIVVADSFQQETLNNLRTLPIQVIEVSFDKSTKAKALNEAMRQLPNDKYDVALILDADNVLHTDFITKINDSFNAGYQVVQGHRAAKNTKGAFAMLDAMSEEINNNIYSKGHRVIGLSSRLVGSGMAFDYQLFKNTMANIDAIGGFDKELELRLLKKKIKFEYRDDAICLDEKVSKAEVFNNQRSRWIAAQYHYFKRHFPTASLHLITRGNVDYFDKAFQMMLPPRLILPGVLFFITAIAFFTSPQLYFYVWGVIFIANILSFIISIPTKFYSMDMIKAFLQIPKAFWGIFKALFKLGNANKTFIHTPHTNVESENTL